ncbi:MAG: hypothetical protein KGH55_03635, partial [Nanoarchaeota archaeon]|nr:hypothetical protein [Nanoarchaeota archaeon]
MNPEEVICKVCRTRFIPSRHARNPMYCSDECKLIAKKERDRQRWALKGLRSKDFFNQKTRGYKDKFPEKSSSQHYAKNHNMRDTECLFCHNKDNLEIHHLIYRTPVMPEDVITVCKKCHGKMDIITKKIFSLAQEEAKKEK